MVAPKIPNQPAVVGARQRMSFSGVLGALVLQPTQLISQRTVAPVQWMISLMPPSTATSVLPYTNSVDGALTYSPLSGSFSAPLLPSVGGDSQLQVALRWGAGGVAFSTAFDYPSHGTVFAIVGDNIDLSVFARNPGASAYNALEDLPHVGAFMVPGSPATPMPLSYRENTGTLAAATSRYYTVKPFAHTVRVAALAADSLRVWFMDTAGATLQQNSLVDASGGQNIVAELPIPNGATVIRVQNQNAGPITAYVEWLIGFA